VCRGLPLTFGKTRRKHGESREANPVVEMRSSDDFGQPLDRAGVVTPGAIGAEFILARWNPDNYDAST